MIAIALACEPKLLLADEPTTALDVTIQAQILELLDGLRERLGMAMLLITHDMGVVAGRAEPDRVMYAGRIVESAPTERALQRDAPSLHAGPARLDPAPGARTDTQPLFSIPGLPPDLTQPPDRVPLRPALPVRDRPVPRRGAAARRRRPRATSSPAGTRSTARSTSTSRMHGRRRARRRARARRTPRAAARDHERRPRVPGDRGRGPAAQGRLGQGGVRRHASRSARARRSGSSASPAAARRRSAR